VTEPLRNPITAYGRRLGAVFPDGDLVGVYVHGSIALGGFRPDRSDVDVLVVTRWTYGEADQRGIGDALLRNADPCPGTGLEVSVITEATARDLGGCPFEVHVGDGTVVTGAGHPGDPDLILYAEVCRRSAVVAIGAPAGGVFGRVDPGRLRAAIRAELVWGLGNAPFEYAVLNACRARRFAVDGALTSKVDGGAWYLDQHPADPVVLPAYRLQTGEPDGPPPPAEAVAEFVERTIGWLDARA
jgi:streptomycin 3"-adenylyltransferase